MIEDLFIEFNYHYFVILLLLTLVILMLTRNHEIITLFLIILQYSNYQLLIHSLKVLSKIEEEKILAFFRFHKLREYLLIVTLFKYFSY